MVMSVSLDKTTGADASRAATYVWGPDLGSRGDARGDWQRAGGVGGLLMVLGTATATDYFPLHDRMGNIVGYRRADVSPNAATDYNRLSQYGAVYDYDAFGRETRSAGPAADTIPFHFSSKFTDAETGLNYYGYRFYDPVAGRWLNRDPIGERGGTNVVRACMNNLVGLVDLWGLAPMGHHLIPRVLFRDCDKPVKDVCNDKKNALDNKDYKDHDGKSYGGVTRDQYAQCVRDLMKKMFGDDVNICKLTPEELQRLADAIRRGDGGSNCNRYNKAVEEEIKRQTGQPADYPLPTYPPTPSPTPSSSAPRITETPHWVMPPSMPWTNQRGGPPAVKPKEALLVLLGMVAIIASEGSLAPAAAELTELELMRQGAAEGAAMLEQEAAAAAAAAAAEEAAAATIVP